MIWVIGDSHVNLFSGNVHINGLLYGDSADGLGQFKDSFKTIHMNPYTAYNAFSKISEIDNHLTLFNKDTDYLFFCFGEIDCRCHLGFQADIRNIEYNEVVSECISRYSQLLKHYKQQGYDVGVWGVVASGLDNGVQGNGALSYKTATERNIITYYFNQHLETHCEQLNVRYKSIFEHLQYNFETIPTYHYDNIHIMCNKTAQLIIAAFSDIL